MAIRSQTVLAVVSFSNFLGGLPAEFPLLQHSNILHCLEKKRLQSLLTCLLKHQGLQNSAVQSFIRVLTEEWQWYVEQNWEQKEEMGKSPGDRSKLTGQKEGWAACLGFVCVYVKLNALLWMVFCLISMCHSAQWYIFVRVVAMGGVGLISDTDPNRIK